VYDKRQFNKKSNEVNGGVKQITLLQEYTDTKKIKNLMKNDDLGSAKTEDIQVRYSIIM
jgi:hypothetical protein